MIKISRPIPDGEYIRHRLFRRMDELRTKQVTWLSAPAGSGKTTLVGSYIQYGKIPCLWYQLDAGDADLATFFYYMGEAGKKAASKKKKALPLFTPEYLLGIKAFSLRYFEELYNRLKKPGLIVFDNYHEIPLDSALHDVMLHAFSMIPPGIHAVVISRNEPHPAFIRLKAGMMLDSVGWEEIKLVEEESEGIIRMRMPGESDDHRIREIQGMAGGWAAGLTLMAEAMKRKNQHLKVMGTFTREEIFTYFVQEVFKGLDEKTRSFMLKTAYLSKMTTAMACELSGEAFSGRILSDMVRCNYFISERFDPLPSYEYHPLYREFLLSRAGEDLSPSEQTATRRSAALILEQSGQTGEAVDLLRAMGDWEGIAGIVLAHGKDMVSQGRFVPLQRWIEDIPEDILSGNPWLLYWKGMSLLTFLPLQAKPLFEKAYDVFSQGDDSMGALLSASAAMNAIYIGTEDYEPLDHWFSVVNDLCREAGSFPAPEIEAWVTSGMMAALGLREIVHPEADEWVERVYRLDERPASIIPKANALHQLFWFGAMRSGLPAIRRAETELKRMARQRDAHPLVVITSKRVENSYYQLSGMTERCIESANEGLELSRKHGILFFDFVFMVTKVTSLLDAMDINGARRVLGDLLSSDACLSRHGRAAFLMYSTREALISDEPEKALAQAGELYHLVRSLNSPFGYGMCLLRKALAFHFLGKKDEAWLNLKDVFDMADTHASQWLRMFAFYHHAHFSFEQGDEERGREALGQSLIRARKSGYVFCTDDHPGITSRLCVKALERGIEKEYVKEIILRRGFTPPLEAGTGVLALDEWPWPVKIYTLGRFEIVRDGVPLVFSGKVQKKPLEMLKAIIAMGGTHVPVEQLTDTLWPDADGDLAHKSFEVTLSRLRKLLGREEIITYSAGQLGLDPLRCRVDSLVLESVMTSMVTVEGAAFVGICEKVLPMYKGSFLPGDTGLPWSSPRRDVLHNHMLRILIRAGRHYECVGQWEKALDYYLKGIEIDSLAESFYQRCMVCCLELGHGAEAVKVYHACSRLLKVHLGISPSEATEAIYTSVLNKR
ncbi:MAG: hypothetical protein KKD44_22560 [Proteobacteria bacterium]|nr:hypothetical protein [Pseudomonadota bacterium]